ncbi:hypothetical protein [Acidovorax lacteus]|uniref:Uncharacterized protein n=1 Tax=Acidovorax lacteus TaxID=1924988 RepID=A0ABP8L8Z3_9BURK
MSAAHPHHAAGQNGWERFLAGHGSEGTPPPATALSPADADRVAAYRDALLQALAQRDRQALAQAQARLAQAAWRARPLAAPPLRRALRELAWRAAGLGVALRVPLG